VLLVGPADVDGPGPGSVGDGAGRDGFGVIDDVDAVVFVVAGSLIRLTLLVLGVLSVLVVAVVPTIFGVADIS
jgi:hypothetical protein